jgi:hypothetical protein
MNITLETIKPPKAGLLDLNVQVTANIHVTAQQACRQVSTFVGNEIADLLHGETPDLVVRQDGTYWRVPVVLSSRSLGRIGVVGSIDVHVETGDLRLTDRTIAEIESNAQRFAAGTALSFVR